MDLPVAIRSACDADLPALLGLLEASDLPTVGVGDFLDGFVVAVLGREIVGVAGLEVHGRDGLLRSVAVRPGRRGRGLGDRLTGAIVDAARSAGLRRLYLLTTTADRFFAQRGFRVIDRGAASEAVRQSVEFREACPESAVAMAMDLADRARRAGSRPGPADPASD